MAGPSESFVGRESELDELASILRERRGGVALIAGEAGIGKSRLVSEALRGDAPPSVAGFCWPGDGAPALWPWIQVVKACVAGAADDAISLLRPATSGDASQFALFESVTDVVRAAAQPDGLVVVLEDLHWADDASLRLLGFAVRALREQPVTVIGTYRDDGLGSDERLPALLAELAGDARHVRLAGLDVVALGQLANATDDHEDRFGAEQVGELHRLTGGNPFFAREVLKLARARQPGASRLRVPAGVRAVILQRLARLSNACADALQTAAVLGPTFSAEELARVTGDGMDDMLRLLDEALGALVVVADEQVPGGLRFAHDLLRETVYESTPATERAAIHARAAAVLEARGGSGVSAATLAHHLMNAVPVVDRGRAVAGAMRAGDAAMAVHAHTEASEWFERAISLVRADTVPETDAIAPLLALGEARLRASDLRRARDAYVEAANIARRHDRDDDLAQAALGLGAGLGGFEIGLFDHVQIELLEEALRALDTSDATRRAQLLARLSVALSFVAEERRLELSREAVAMARRLDDRSTLGYALAAYCDAIAGPAHSEARRDAASEVVALGQELGDRRLELLGRRVVVVALLELGAVTEADAQIRAFAAAADALREPLYRWYVPLWRGMRALMAGRIEESARWCAEAAAIGEDAGSTNAVMLTLTQQWVRLRVAGRFGAAAQLMDEHAISVFGALAGTYAVGAWSRLYAGDHDAARSLLHDFTRDLARVPPDAEWLPTIAQLAEVAAELRDRESAAVLDAVMAPFDGRVVVEGIGAAVYGTLGAFRAPLARLLGRDDEARQLAQDAAAAAQRIGLVGVPYPPGAGTGTPPAPNADTEVGVASRVDAGWTLEFAGQIATVRDSKGVRDLAALLTSPGAAIHVRELVAADSDGVLAVAARGDDVLDPRAIAEYRRRLDELHRELEAADRHDDVDRSAKLSEEREFLLAELGSSTGLGGRQRRMGDDVDRARKAVRARVRDAIARIEAVHPALGRHLTRSVRTGTFCSYDPETPVSWRVRSGS
ncbi:MAG TPA: AAA family ATPase [Acidimicrobiales bacterium]|nr:AAA family ATPase [Acidimicrobiales bacterium]